ncbi:hypothetical protein L6V77_23595 [Myxococcota bacterium]|nr:hypothetical protein [Myxococcota bacterium]
MRALHIVLVVEGSSDRRRLGILFDEVFESHGVEWSRESFDVADWLAQKDIRQRHRAEVDAGGFGRPARGFGAQQRGDRENIRLLVQMLTKRGLTNRDDVVVCWARDVDGDDDRHLAARDGPWGPFSRRLHALASECGEAWVIAGWPATGDGRRAAAAVRQSMRLVFDPVAAPHRLSHKADAPTSAKRCLAKLLESGVADEADCLTRAARERPRGVGESGLAAFLDELHTLAST